VNGHKITAVIDSGAAWTVISPRVVEKHNIPYRVKDRPIRVVLADYNPMEYGSGLIRLETQPVPFLTAELGQGHTEVLNIMDLGEEDMLIGYE
jgi:predicted aspartyl protease